MLRKLIFVLLIPAIGCMAGCKISGKISDKGMALKGVKVTLKGKVNLSTTTDDSGTFNFASLYISNGNFIVTAEKEGYTFIPPNKQVMVRNDDVTDVDFYTEHIWEGDFDTREHEGRIDILKGYTSINGTLSICETDLKDLKGLDNIIQIKKDLLDRKSVV